MFLEIDVEPDTENFLIYLIIKRKYVLYRKNDKYKKSIKNKIFIKALQTFYGMNSTSCPILICNEDS